MSLSHPDAAIVLMQGQPTVFVTMDTNLRIRADALDCGDGPVSLVAPLYATYPLFTVGLSVLFLGNVRITWRLVAGTALTVGGVILVLAG